MSMQYNDIITTTFKNQQQKPIEKPIEKPKRKQVKNACGKKKERNKRNQSKKLIFISQLSKGL